jgi:hypothetical protein
MDVSGLPYVPPSRWERYVVSKRRQTALLYEITQKMEEFSSWILNSKRRILVSFVFCALRSVAHRTAEIVLNSQPNHKKRVLFFFVNKSVVTEFLARRQLKVTKMLLFFFATYVRL